jgi:hypothetical protein
MRNWPPAVTPLAVPFNGMTVVALLFETDRAPYVVINPAGGRIFEVRRETARGRRGARRSAVGGFLEPPGVRL